MTHKVRRQAIYACHREDLWTECRRRKLDLRRNADVDILYDWALTQGIELGEQRVSVPTPAKAPRSPQTHRSRLAPDHRGPDLTGIKTPAGAAWRRTPDKEGWEWGEYRLYLNVNRGFEVSVGEKDRNGHRWWYEVFTFDHQTETSVGMAPNVPQAKKLAYAIWAGLDE